MELIDIVKKLVGPIEPLGDASRDGDRLVNIRELVQLANAINQELLDVVDNKFRQESSMKAIGEVAAEYFDELKQHLNE